MRSFPRSLVALLPTFGLVACVSFPYPLADEQIGLQQRIDKCFLAIPAFDAFALIDYATVPSLQYPGQCEVWYKFEKFAKEIGRSEKQAAESGSTIRYEYDYTLDVLTRSIDFTPSAEVFVRGKTVRSVTSTARVTGINGTLTAEVRTIWKKHSLGWDIELVGAEYFDEAISLALVDDVVEPTRQVLCRLTHSDAEEELVCRDEAGRWIVMPSSD